MKPLRCLFPVILFISAFSNFTAAQQSIHVTFTGLQGSANVPMDSLVIRNLSQGSDTVLYFPDSVLYFLWAGQPEQQFGSDLITGPYPNPGEGQTFVNVYLEKAVTLSWELSGVSGQVLAANKKQLNIGNHRFMIVLPEAGTYLLKMEWAGNRQVKKILCTKSRQFTPEVRYLGLSGQDMSQKFPANISTLNFIPGDILSSVGYAGNLTAQSINKVDSTILVYLHFAPACPGASSISYDGFEYHTVQIGSQCWLRENLRPGMMIPASSQQTNNFTIEKYCYQDDPDNCLIYGGLYSWKEMMKYSYTPGITGICPAGFHVPTEAEWNKMLNYIDHFPGGKLKATGTTTWLAPNTGATDEFGFDALGAGYVDDQRDFYNLKKTTRFWTSSNMNNWFGINRCIDYNRSGVYPYGYGSMDYSYSVRCIKDCDQVGFVDAGPNQNVVYSTCVQLNANMPGVGETGLWTIVSGGPGYFSNAQDPNSHFTGWWYGPYTLQWTISNTCSSVNDHVQIAYYFDVCPGIPQVNYGNQAYYTDQIGRQCWFRENLNIGNQVPYAQNQTDDGQIEKYCYNNDPANCITYGGLYQWNELMQYDTLEGIQGICPLGWHIPTKTETDTLDKFLGYSNVSGGKLKETGTQFWMSPNTGATNLSQFSAYGSGYRSVDPFIQTFALNQQFDMWTSTKSNYSKAIERYLYFWDNNHSQALTNRSSGLSVRCLKNNPQVSQANAGSDQTLPALTPVLLNANNPGTGESGFWQVILGAGGSFQNIHDPLTIFKGFYNQDYLLRWTILNAYDSSYDEMIVHFEDVPCPAVPSLNYGGRTYKTVQVGNQCWMKESLNIGTMIPVNLGSSNNGIIEKFCYQNDTNFCNLYGAFYNWNEIMEYTQIPGCQGICPQGWHIPTVNDFETLMDYLGGQGTAGGKMKQAGNQTWNFISPGATNSSGMKVPGAGCRVNTGSFFYYTESALIWTSDVYDNNGAYTLRLSAVDDQSVINNVPKTYGNSVRCLKD